MKKSDFDRIQKYMVSCLEDSAHDREIIMLKKRTVATVVVTIIIFLIIVLTLIKHDSSEPQYSSNELTSFSQPYFTLQLPSNWSLVESTNNCYYSFDIDKTTVAHIEYFGEVSYNINAGSFVSNAIGVHAFIDSDITESEVNGYKLIAFLVSYENSPAQDDNGEMPNPSELHYYLIDNGNVIDVVFDPRYTDRNLSDKIIHTFQFNSSTK